MEIEDLYGYDRQFTENLYYFFDLIKKCLKYNKHSWNKLISNDPSSDNKLRFREKRKEYWNKMYDIYYSDDMKNYETIINELYPLYEEYFTSQNRFCNKYNIIIDIIIGKFENDYDRKMSDSESYNHFLQTRKLLYNQILKEYNDINMINQSGIFSIKDDFLIPLNNYNSNLDNYIERYLYIVYIIFFMNNKEFMPPRTFIALEDMTLLSSNAEKLINVAYEITINPNILNNLPPFVHSFLDTLKLYAILFDALRIKDKENYLHKFCQPSFVIVVYWTSFKYTLNAYMNMPMIHLMDIAFELFLIDTTIVDIYDFLHLVSLGYNPLDYFTIDQIDQMERDNVKLLKVYEKYDNLINNFETLQ